MRVVKSETRLVFMGFGFEAIDNQTDRAMLMNSTLPWLTGLLIAVDDAGVATPERVMLDEPRPNPFNPTVTVPFALEATGPVTLRVIDSSGRAVRTLLDRRPLPPGPRAVSWDGRDDAGRNVAAGAYLARVRAGNRHGVTRMILLR